MALTERQAQILEFVTATLKRNGRPPSYREIGRRFGIASTNGVRDHLEALQRKGYLTIARRRGITLRRDEGIPLLGRVPAGSPLLSDENLEAMIKLPDYFGPEGELIALRVKGDSMTGAGISDGDVVLVRVAPRVENGQIGVVLIDGEATVKRLYDDGPRLRLKPENPRLHEFSVPKESAEIRVVGRVVGLLRRL